MLRFTLELIEQSVCQAFCIWIKEQSIYTLSHTQLLFQQTPIERYVTHNHITLDHLVAAHFKIICLGKLFALRECKGILFDFVGYAVMQSAPIINQFIDNPRSCRAANNQQNILTYRSPIIPKMLQTRNKVGFGCIHPWKFIQENNLLAFG